MTIQMIRAALFGFTALACAGCTHLTPVRVAADFGSSNRNLIAQQVFDTQTSMEPSTDTPTGLDGNKVGKILDAYRNDNSSRSFEDAGVSTNSVTQSQK